MTAAPACPKCGAPRRADAAACARCGLVYERWSPEGATSGALALDERAEALWRAAAAAWEDPAGHDAFLKYCSTVGSLPAAGRKYRERLDRDPVDATAARMQQRVVAMAMATLPPPRVVPGEPITRKKWFWWVFFGAISLGAMAGMWFIRR